MEIMRLQAHTHGVGFYIGKFFSELISLARIIPSSVFVFEIFLLPIVVIRVYSFAGLPSELRGSLYGTVPGM